MMQAIELASRYTNPLRKSQASGSQLKDAQPRLITYGHFRTALFAFDSSGQE